MVKYNTFIKLLILFLLIIMFNSNKIKQKRIEIHISKQVTELKWCEIK